MANLFKTVARDSDQKRQAPLPIVTPEVIVNGSVVTLKLDLAKVSDLAVEREAEALQPDGSKRTYIKSPSFMLAVKLQDVEVIKVDPETQETAIFSVGLNFGRAGGGVYCTLGKPTLIEMVGPNDPPLDAVPEVA